MRKTAHAVRGFEDIAKSLREPSLCYGLVGMHSYVSTLIAGNTSTARAVPAFGGQVSHVACVASHACYGSTTTAVCRLV